MGGIITNQLPTKYITDKSRNQKNHEELAKNFPMTLHISLVFVGFSGL